jgi:oxalate---CoA ligase
VMQGYLDDEEANRAAFVDGWFRTGDIGSIDAEGFVTLLGRVKEFINRGGEKISPYEVERALLLHPGVREAAAFAVPHPRLGQNLAAAVVLNPDANTTPAEIKSFLLDHLAPFKVPQQVLVKAEFPKGATGKTLRRELAEEATQGAREAVPPFAPLHSQILEIWEALLGRSDIGIDDDFFEAGGDSLLATQMVCDVEQATHQQIPPSALRSVFTVRDLAATVLRGSSKTMELVTCAKPGSGVPLFFCHGDYTSRGFYALRLADMLSADQPVFLVHPYPNPGPNSTMEEMVQAYIAQILQAHPAGPLHVGGHCNGGVFAWAIAHQLERLGRDVRLIALIDVPSLNARSDFRAMARLNRFAAAVAPEKLGRKLASHGMHALWTRIRQSSGPYSRAIANYIPQRVTARVVCMISEECRPKTAYSWTPWANVADDVCCKYVAGSHFGAITKHVGAVADLLDDFMSPAQISRPA